MDKNDIVINEGYLGLNPVQFGEEHCEPSHSFGPAVRDYYLLHFVVSGCGCFVRKGNTYSVSAGEIFVIPPHKETFYKADEKNPWHYIWIGFTTDMKLPEAFSQ